MSYHRFSNVKELLNGDLTSKLMDGIIDTDVQDLECNCNRLSKNIDGKCIFDGKCRLQMAIYEIEFPKLQKSYIGKTQRHVKERIKEQIHNAWLVIKTGREKTGIMMIGMDLEDIKERLLLVNLQQANAENVKLKTKSTPS